MQKTSDLYQELLASEHIVETRLAVGEAGILITKRGEGITFGGTRILTGASGPDSGYDESLLISMTTKSRVFSDNTPSVGDCVSGEIKVEMYKPIATIPEQARLVPYVRLSDGIRKSEWIQKGVFYIDTREKKEDGSAIEKIILRGYDSMMKAEQDYPASNLSWPARDIDVVKEIASFLDIPLDKRTEELMTWGYMVQYPGEYSCRETLGFIASMYAGSFVITDNGELRLVGLADIPTETRYLIASVGQPITFGGVRILV